MERLPGTTSDDLNAVIRAGGTIITATRQLDKLDEALQRASDMELQDCLFGSRPIQREPWPWKFDPNAVLAYDALHQKMLQWAASLPQPESLQAELMIDRRRELVLHLFALIENFEQTTDSIDASFRQYNSPRLLGKLDNSLGQPLLPREHELEQARHAVGIAGAVAAGIDAAYPLTPAPELSELESAVAASVSAERPDLSVG